METQLTISIHLLQIHLLAARGEKESVQIALRPRCSWGPLNSGQGGEVQIHVSDFRSDGGERLKVGEHVTLRRVVPVYGIPDALLPLQVPTSCLHLPHG